MRVFRDRYLAIWVTCPTCGRKYAYPQLPPSRKWRKWTPENCERCHTPMGVRRRYYTLYAQDFYSKAGTCKEVCDLYYKHPREFRLARVEAERKRLAYQQQRREQEQKWAAERKLLDEAQLIARKVTQAGVMEAEVIARSAWEASKPHVQDGDFDPFLD